MDDYTAPVSPLKAIQTRYKGCHFRSRLEARWAVFFDALEIAWEYEPQGYMTPEGPYLPDFWLPQVRMFAEVKPSTFSDVERAKCAGLPSPCIMLEGPPAPRPYWVASVKPDNEDFWDGCDVIFGDSHMYHLTEHRLYSGSGATHDDPTYWKEAWECAGAHWEQRAIDAARSARFEHGESGAS